MITTNMCLSIIVAMDRKRAIGKDGGLPWHLSRDLKNFKKITMGKPIIMGRKTYDSIGRPLPGRKNIVLTRDRSYKSSQCTVLHAFEDIFSHCQDRDEAVIIGGTEIYKQAMSQAERLYLTEVDAEVEGDTFFPEFDRQCWQEVETPKTFVADDKNDFDYRFSVLEKRV